MTGVSIIYFVFLILAAYMIGSFPTGLILGKLYGIDVRKAGSGNVGATNLYRTVGRKIGIITLIVDCLKGLVPVLVVISLGQSIEFAAFVGFSAFCGHVFSIFLKFRGGKGVATALGVFLALAPMAVTLAIALFALIKFRWRYVSLGSILAAASMPFGVFFMGGNKSVNIVTLIIALIVILRHNENIRRLISGTENKFKA
ncbi:MAG: glycerol-3-phosphate 1-O-acyltransferase PlsY [Desulfuromonadaceae bacterium]|nr:glycerol-3-phosphate 1-O-acyltransferase PlsY [Desulfuromonadaceae bacterium]